MDDQALKEIIFGGTRELMKNRKYYYHSSVGAEYCHWTDERAKEMVLTGLKGERI